MRVNLNIPDDLLSQIDLKAKSLYVSRTAWIVMTLSQKLQQDELILNLPDMLRTMESTMEEMKTLSKDLDDKTVV